MAAAYLLAVDNFERVAHPIVNEVEHPTPADPSLPVDTTFSGATSGSFPHSKLILLYNHLQSMGLDT